MSQLPQVPEKSEIVDFEARVSYDGGETWEAARTRELGSGEYELRLVHPRPERTSGTVSLRVEAWDDAGNRVTQTITDAYPLTARGPGGCGTSCPH